MAQPTPVAAPIGGGWLYKKRATGGWKKRWAIMYGARLTWFETPNLPEAPSIEEGSFDVTSAKCLPMASDKGKWKFCVESGRKQILLYVEEEIARNQWVNGIRSIIDGKFLKGQLMEKPALKTKDGNILTPEELKRLAKSGKVPAGISTALPSTAPMRPATPGTPRQGPYARSVYQIDELNSPSTSTTSMLGKKLYWELEEERRDLVACNLAKERNTFGGAAEIDSDENDWMEEADESAAAGCKQQ